MEDDEKRAIRLKERAHVLSKLGELFDLDDDPKKGATASKSKDKKKNKTADQTNTKNSPKHQNAKAGRGSQSLSNLSNNTQQNPNQQASRGKGKERGRGEGRSGRGKGNIHSDQGNDNFKQDRGRGRGSHLARGRGRGTGSYQIRPIPMQAQNQSGIPFVQFNNPPPQYFDCPPTYEESFKEGKTPLPGNANYPQPILMTPRIVGAPPTLMHQQNPGPNFIDQAAQFRPPIRQLRPQRNEKPKLPVTVNKKSTVNKLHPADIAKELQTIPGFWTNGSTLSKMLKRSYEETMDIVIKNTGFFLTRPDESAANEKIIELHPKIKICQEYMTDKGCLKGKCCFLHICQDFILSQCLLKSDCNLGHNLKTNHNIEVFKAFCISEMPPHLLLQVLKKVLVVNSYSYPRICSKYQTNSCNIDPCMHLHICYDYVSTMGSCSLSSCSLNHKINIQSCEKVLKTFGISTNESPKDLLKQVNEKSELSAFSNASDTTSGESKTGAKSKNQKKIVPISEKKENCPVLAWNLEGDVEYPFMCLNRLENKCNDYKGDCKYLHSKLFSHWQFQIKKWYNFHLFHSKILDRSFKDPSCDDLVLPKLDSKYCSGTMSALPSLLGSSELKVDFKSMTISSEKITAPLTIRNITTPSSNSVDNAYATDFVWYFENDDNEWQLFKPMITMNDISSVDIENGFLSCKLTNNIRLFSAGDLHLDIDYSKMIITNIKTGAVCKIKRRPKKVQKSELISMKLPANWSEMSSENSYKIFKLDADSEEFNKIKQSVLLTHPICQIVAIQRVQNPDLWRQFKYREKELMAKYSKAVNVQNLFFSILDPNHLSEICKDNIEEKHHGDVITTNYGKGTYFFSCFAKACNNSTEDYIGYKQVLVSEVIIGEVTEGDSTMTQPPQNLTTQSLYDTTVDTIESPSIYVKFDKQEYYPSYVVVCQ